MRKEAFVEMRREEFVPQKPAAVCLQVEVGGGVLLVKPGLQFKGCFVALR